MLIHLTVQPVAFLREWYRQFHKKWIFQSTTHYSILSLDHWKFSGMENDNAGSKEGLLSGNTNSELADLPTRSDQYRQCGLRAIAGQRPTTRWPARFRL